MFIELLHALLGIAFTMCIVIFIYAFAFAFVKLCDYMGLVDWLAGTDRKEK